MSNTVGDMIKIYRELRGVKQNVLAEQLGIKPNTLSAWENNINGVDTKMIWPICKALAITPSMLLDVDSDEINKVKLLEHEEQILLNGFRRLPQQYKDVILNMVKGLVKAEDEKLITFMPMLVEGQLPTTEIDYYPQAAGMGGGQYVTDAIPEKINVPSFEVPPKTDFIIQVVGDSMEPSFKTGDKLFIESTTVLHLGDIGVFNYLGEQLVKEFGKGELISHNKSYEPIKVNEKDLYIQGRVLGKV